MRVYLDSCIVIYLVEGSAEIREQVSRLLLPPKDPIPEVVFTDLTRLECRVKPLAAGDSARLADYDEFFATPGYEKQPLGTRVFDLATELRARHGLKTPDALHLAAAIDARCDRFWTNDARLTAAAAGRIRVLVPGESA